MRRIWRDNGLTMVLMAMFLATFLGQAESGHRVHDHEQRQHGEPPESFLAYIATPAFMEATAENWESEFLQMGVFVLLTSFLYQRGSAESKDPDRPSPVDREPDPQRPDAPWPVRRGGMAMTLYSHSLSLMFFFLFLVSLAFHAVGGAGDYNEEQAVHGDPEVTAWGYLATSRFWFESLQNWQSEFLSIAAMVVFTIFLRERGSPESKPVDAADSETGQS
jgi:hypothetical protein